MTVARGDLAVVPRRSRDQVIAGVCGGWADELDVDPMVFRTLYTITLVFFGLGVPLYLALYFAMEEQPGAQRIGLAPA